MSNKRNATADAEIVAVNYDVPQNHQPATVANHEPAATPPVAKKKNHGGTITRHPKLMALNRAWSILEPLSVADRAWLLNSLRDIALPAPEPEPPAQTEAPF